MRPWMLPLVLAGLFQAAPAQTWTRVSTGLPQDTAVLSLAKMGGVLFAGTEKAGVYKSVDGGDHWVPTAVHSNFANAQTWTLAVLDTFVFAGNRGNGVLRTSLNGTAWTTANTGIPTGTSRLIQDLITVGGKLYAASWGGGVFVSADTGASWSPLFNNLGLDDLRVLTLAHNGTYLFAGTSGVNTYMPDTGVVFRAPLTGGASWTVINTGLTRNGVHLEATSGLDASDSLLFSGHDDVGIHRSTDNGQHWTPVPGTLNGDVFAIQIVGSQVFYGTTYGGIWTSDDKGLTFKANNTGLSYGATSIPYWVNDLLVSGPYIYAATTIGVFRQSLPGAVGIEAHAAAGNAPLPAAGNAFTIDGKRAQAGIRHTPFVRASKVP